MPITPQGATEACLVKDQRRQAEDERETDLLEVRIDRDIERIGHGGHFRAVLPGTNLSPRIANLLRARYLAAGWHRVEFIEKISAGSRVPCAGRWIDGPERYDTHVDLWK